MNQPEKKENISLKQQRKDFCIEIRKMKKFEFYKKSRKRFYESKQQMNNNQNENKTDWSKLFC